MLHVNDSKTRLGSRVDRHQHIGRGHIGLAAFRRILNHPLLAGRAFILETPIDRPGDDRRNVRTLWRLAGVELKRIRAADGFPRSRRAARAAPRSSRRARQAKRRRVARGKRIKRARRRG